mmetsp:Transcript_10350/g.31154  ORF Transcript_10350/g.31154 Transcript_10350/m.31154 type:complete len:253 (+) Transcript_10350:3046-3804(+)
MHRDGFRQIVVPAECCFAQIPQAVLRVFVGPKDVRRCLGTPPVVALGRRDAGVLQQGVELLGDRLLGPAAAVELSQEPQLLLCVVLLVHHRNTLVQMQVCELAIAEGKEVAGVESTVSPAVIIGHVHDVGLVLEQQHPPQIHGRRQRDGGLMDNASNARRLHSVHQKARRVAVVHMLVAVNLLLHPPRAEQRCTSVCLHPRHLPGTREGVLPGGACRVCPVLRLDMVAPRPQEALFQARKLRCLCAVCCRGF